jgi:integrase
MNASVNIFLRVDQLKKDGAAGLYLRVRINGKKCDISLNQNLNPKQGTKAVFLLSLAPQERIKYFNWNEDSSRVTAGNGLSESLNSLIASERTRAERIILDSSLKGKRITTTLFKEEFLKKSCSECSASDYFTKEIEKRNGTYSKETIKSYKSIVTKMDRFKPGLLLDDITREFLVKYENHMLSDAQGNGASNQKTTVANNLKVIKTLVNIAVSNGDMHKDNNPFNDYSIKKVRSSNRREFVEPLELELLEKLLYEYVSLDKPIQQVSVEEWKEREEKGLLTPSEYNILKIFLFACYTGLRYTDIKELKYSDIKKKMVRTSTVGKLEEKYCIDIDMHKTGFPVIIPLIERAICLIDIGKTEGSVFRIISNQKSNVFLKQVIKKAKIKKKITFHCARHTFASVSLMNDLPEKFVQKILGHRDSKMTQVYTHLVDDYLFTQATKFEERLSDANIKRQDDDNKKNALLDKLSALDAEKMKKLEKLLDIL